MVKSTRIVNLTAITVFPDGFSSDADHSDSSSCLAIVAHDVIIHGSFENSRGRAKKFRKKKLRGKGFTRVTKRRSCPARKKLKSGHKAGRGSWIGDRLAVGTKTGDRIGHGDDEVPRHWPRCGANNGQRTSSG